MKADRLLVQHPGPNKTESLFGYLLRLSEKNGYSSPWQVLLNAGMKQSEARTAGMRVAKLASVANRRLDELEPIAYYVQDHPNRCRLLGHALLPRHLRLTKPAICPFCVADREFIEAHWDLEIMSGCPLHRCRLLGACPTCKKELTLFRRGILTCSCGTDLSGANLEGISQAEADLLEVFRRIVLGLPCLDNSASGLPVSQLSRMELHPLLAFTHTLARHYRNAFVSEGPSLHDAELAARVLSAWPGAFWELLNSIVNRGESRVSGLSRGPLGPIYIDLFKNKSIPDPAQVEFVMHACVEFLANRSGEGLIDHKLLQRANYQGSVRYVGIMTMAARLGIHKRTIRRKTECHLDENYKREQSARRIFDSDALAINRLLPGRIFRKREAAKRIGITAALLSALRRSGDFEVKSTPADYPGFHEKDVDGFIYNLNALASPIYPLDRSRFLTLRSAFRVLRFSVDAQQDLVHRILAGTLATWTQSDDSIGNCLVRNEDVVRVLEEHLPWYSNTMTGRDAAKTIGLASECIAPLVENHYLQQINTPLGGRIDKGSIVQFVASFLPMSKIATEVGTSTRGLMRRCADQNVFMLVVEFRNLKHALIKVEDSDLVRGFWKEDAEKVRDVASSGCDRSPCRSEEIPLGFDRGPNLILVKARPRGTSIEP